MKFNLKILDNIDLKPEEQMIFESLLIQIQNTFNRYSGEIKRINKRLKELEKNK